MPLFPSSRKVDGGGLRHLLAAEPSLLLAATVLMAIGVAVNHGHFAWRAIALITASSGLFVLAARVGLACRWPAGYPFERIFAGVLIALIVAGLTDAPGYYLHSASYRTIATVLDLSLATALVGIFFGPKPAHQAWPAVFVGGLLIGFGLRIWIISASPRPVIDVFNQFQESSAHWLAGLNPYATAVSDPLAGIKSFGYHVLAYSYPPANLYAQLAAFALLGDIRYAHVAAEAIGMICLYHLAPRHRRTAGGLLVLLFLFHPRGLFVIEQAWTEPLLVGAGGLFLLAATRWPKHWAISLTFGLFLSLKQYLVFFAALYFLIARRWRLLAPTALVVLATWVPFLIWDAPSVIANGLLFQFRTPFRTDGLNLSSVLYRAFGWEPTKWVAIGVGLLTMTQCGRLFSGKGLGGYLYASILTTLASFLFGSQAFCNYYYFLGAMALFLIAIRMREEPPDA